MLPKNLGAGPVVSVERKRDVLVELSPIVRKSGLQVIEDRNGQPARIQGRHRTDQHRHGDTFRAMPANVTGNFSAAGGVPHMDCALEPRLKCNSWTAIATQTVSADVV